MRVLRMFHCLTRGSRVSPSSGACRGAPFALVVFCVFVVCLVCFASPVLQVPEVF